MRRILARMLKEKSRFATAVLAIVAVVMSAATSVKGADEAAVLVYTHNGLTVDGKKGYVHDNIPQCVKAIQKIGDENHFKVTVSDDPAVFTNTPLKKFKAIIFANSNNKAFDTEAEKKAFQDYIHAGGGFMGIHSATGSERDWPWFWNLIGGTFSFHAPLQKFTVQIKNKKHPSTAFFPGDTWDWEDEFYVMKEQPKGLHVALGGNIKPLKGMEKKGAELPDFIPLAWYHEFEGSRSFYTALGHKKEYYSDPMFVKHLTGGILWVMGK